MYLRLYNTFVDSRYEDNPYDPDKVTEWYVYCGTSRRTLEELYEKIPQIVKDENLVPNIH